LIVSSPTGLLVNSGLVLCCILFTASFWPFSYIQPQKRTLKMKAGSLLKQLLRGSPLGLSLFQLHVFQFCKKVNIAYFDLMTKGQIDRLGDQIRLEGAKLEEATLEKLQEYRTSYKDSLATVFNVLCQTTKQINVSSIVTYRLKRFESIIGKLSRYPDMKFNRMWDIAGCRCILRSDEHVYKMKQLITSRLQIRKEYDYLKKPQDDGYRSLHLFVSLPDDDKVIEVQLRNQTDHNWATLVEITDLLFNTKIKEYGDDPLLLRFHLLLARKEDRSIEETFEIAEIIRKYKYVEKLSEVFSRNYIEVRQQWLEIETKPKHKYFLIEANRKEVPKIQSFLNFTEAEKSYFQTYKSHQTANVVLTHLPKPSYLQISIAYSNYILTFHSFLDDCYSILERAIVESLDNNELRKFYRYYSLYISVVFNHIRNLASEVGTLNSRIKIRRKGLNKKMPKKEQEWVKDIKDQIGKRQQSQKKLVTAVSTHIPKGRVQKFVFNQILNHVNRTYKSRFKRVLNSVK
jgi:putative GTP pyrophosphokinase